MGHAVRSLGVCQTETANVCTDCSWRWSIHRINAEAGGGAVAQKATSQAMCADVRIYARRVASPLVFFPLSTLKIKKKDAAAVLKLALFLVAPSLCPRVWGFFSSSLSLPIAPCPRRRVAQCGASRCTARSIRGT